MNIVMPDKVEISDYYRSELEDMGVDIYDDEPTSDEVKDRVSDADIITSNFVDISPDVIDSTSNLKYIISTAVGYEWIDVDYASEKGIRTLNCPTFNNQAVAEHAISLMMATNRNLRHAQDKLRNGNWDSRIESGYELANKNMGLVGYGRIGKKIGDIATALSMNVDFVNSRSTSEDIDNLVKDSDFLVVCAPLNHNTRHMLNERRLDLMKLSSIIVNVGRGAVIDQVSLVDKLKAGRIRGAGLDVYENEPLVGNPGDDIVEIANLPNVIATPHIAYNTEEMKHKQGKEILENIQSCISGEPINVVR